MDAKTIGKNQASQAIADGESVYAVAEAGTFRLFVDLEAAEAWADKLGVTHVLDWETGDYA